MLGRPADDSPEADLAARMLAITVVRAGKAGVRRVEAEVLRPLRISFSGYELLLHLWLRGPRESRDLARVLGVSVPSITSLVNTLERRGLVARERSAEDGRLVSISITYEGIALAREARLGVHSVESRAASALSPEERRSMQAYLDRYLAAIGESWADAEQARLDLTALHPAVSVGADAAPPRRTRRAPARPRQVPREHQTAGATGSIDRPGEVLAT